MLIFPNYVKTYASTINKGLVIFVTIFICLMLLSQGHVVCKNFTLNLSIFFAIKSLYLNLVALFGH